MQPHAGKQSSHCQESFLAKGFPTCSDFQSGTQSYGRCKVVLRRSWLGIMSGQAHLATLLTNNLLAKGGGDRLGLTRKSRSLVDGKREVNLLIYCEQCNSGQTKQILEVTSTGRGVHSKETHIQWEGLTRTARSQLRRASPEQ